MVSDLVTLARAKAHLRLSAPASPLTDEDTDVQEKLDHAEAIVLDYCGNNQDWTAVTVPLPVVAAILEQCAQLWRFRGDDAAQDVPKREHGYLAPNIVAKLHRFRDPAFS